MTESLGQTVVVENRGGGGTLVGIRAAAAAPADGYSLLVTTSALSLNPLTDGNAGYRLEDFAAVGLAGQFPYVLMVPASLPVRGAKALGDPMLWVLHLGYAWLVFALGLFGWVGLSEGGLSSSVALHALTVGAVGTMTIGMMVRVALGHTGRALEAGIGGTIPFLLVQGAAVFRLIPGLVGFLDPFPWLVLSSVCWAGAFAVYLIFFTRILFTPRPDGQEA